MGWPVHAVHALDVAEGLSAMGRIQEHEKVRLRTRERILRWAGECLGASLPNLRVIWGHPVQVLLTRARDVRAELLLVGSHQRRPGDYFLGGTADRLLRGAACPVLVRRQPPAPERPILVPIDLSEESRIALRIATRLARVRGAELLTLFIRDRANRDPGDRYSELVAAAGYPIRALTDQGDPRVRIAHHAHRENVDMVVMGSHGRTGLARWALGSVTESVLRRTDLSVLAVKAEDREFLLEAPVSGKSAD